MAEKLDKLKFPFLVALALSLFIFFQNCGLSFQVASEQYSVAQLGSPETPALNPPIEQKISSLGTLRGCLVTPEDTVKCWGSNSRGQLGNNGFVDSVAPVDTQGKRPIGPILDGGYLTSSLASFS